MQTNSQLQIPFLMYHDIEKEGDPYSVPKANFLAQMNFLEENNYKTITLDDFFIHQKENMLIPSKEICITFDDGYKNNFTRAYPILQESNFKATFFITTKYIDTPRGLSKVQIQELAESGMCIGSHTKNHLFLSDLKPDKIYSELKDSKRILEDITTKKVIHLSVPGGRFNERVIEIAKKTGYETICTSEIGINNSNSNPFALKRISLKKKH